MALGLDHVRLAAPPGCEDEARRFVGGLLELDEVGQPDRASRAGRRRMIATLYDVHGNYVAELAARGL